MGWMAAIRIGVPLLLVIALLSCWIGWTDAAHDRDAAQAEVAQLKSEVERLEIEAQIAEAASIARADDADQSRTEAQELGDARNNPNDSADLRELRALCVRYSQRAGAGAALPAECGRFEAARGAGNSAGGI